MECHLEAGRQPLDVLIGAREGCTAAGTGGKDPLTTGLAFEEADHRLTIFGVAGAPGAGALRVDLDRHPADRSLHAVRADHPPLKQVGDRVRRCPGHGVDVARDVRGRVDLDPAAGPDLIEFRRSVVAREAVFRRWRQAGQRLRRQGERQRRQQGKGGSSEKTEHVRSPKRG